MLHKRIVSAFKKIGVEVQERCTVANSYNGDAAPRYLHKFFATNGDTCLEWSLNGGASTNDTKSEEIQNASIMYFVQRHPETNSSVDLFMDRYIETVKGAVAALKEGKSLT